MKTKNQITNRILSLVLSIMMVVSMLPAFSLKAEAATANDKVWITNGTAIYLKGNAATIEAGTKSGYTKLKIGSEYVDFSQYKSSSGDPLYTLGDSNYEADLSNTVIYGGQYASMNGNVNITMTGGVVSAIRGSCSDPGSVLTGNVNITLNGGRVTEISGAHYSVDGNINITVTGGTVSSLIAFVYRANSTVSGDCRLTVTGGSIGFVYDQYGSGSKINGKRNLYSTVAPSSTHGIFDNFIYFDGVKWEFGGNTATALNGNTLTIESNQTATVDSGKTLSGTIVNNGTISVKNGGTLSGTVANNGTVWCYGNISGVANSNSGKIIKKVTASGTNIIIDDSEWQNNNTNYDDDYKATLKAASYNVLPKSVMVTVGDTTLAENSYTYNSNTGELIIPTEIITADTTVSATVLLDLSSPALTVETEHTAYTYTGSEITPAIIVNGEKLGENDYTAVYTNNIDCGTASVTITGKGNFEGTTTKTFEIKEANISDATVTLNPTSGSYNGIKQEPAVSVTLDGFGTLVKDTDYTLSWDKNGFITSETYTVRVVGTGNFTGYVDKTFNINAADLDDVEVKQIGTLTYNGGDALPPTVSTNAVAVNNQPITFTYSTEQNGNYGELPTFTKAGTYTVYYKASAPNHNDATGSFTVTVNKAIVTEPTIASKPYTGSVQTADVSASDLYTVEENNGGKNAGNYDVVLKLTDSANYKWATTDNAEITLQFKIIQAINAWVTTPDITGWTYGEAAKAPVGEAKFGEVSVEYSGTTNGGATYSSLVAPTEAGSYKATFTVQETEDYSALNTSVDFTIAKADQAAPTGLTKTDTTYFGKADGKISGLTSAMEFRKEGDSTYTAGFNGTLEYLASGTYYVRYQGDANHNPSPDAVVTVNAGRKLQIVVPQNQVGYTVTVNKTEMEYEGSYMLKVEIHEGYTATENFKIIISNWECGQQAGVEKTYMNAIADQIIEVRGVADITPPAAEIKVKENKWTSFWNNLTFGIFFKETQDVTITATDKGSGVNKVQYHLAGGELSGAEVEQITEWEDYNGTFKIDPNNRYVVYAKVTDNTGNTLYINSDGIVLDNIAPTLEGIENGKTYYGDLTVIKSDEQFYDIKAVTLDEEEMGFAEGTYGLIPADNAEHIVVVEDHAGNKTTYTVTVYKNYTVTYKADGEPISTETVGHGKDATLPAVPAKDGYVGKWDSDGKNITDDTTISVVCTEIPAVKPDEVKPEDKSDLEDSKAKLEEMLEDDSYTDDDKTDIQEAIDEIDDALEVIGNVEAVEESIVKLPAVDTVKPDDEEAIKAITDAQTAYNALSDYEKSLVDEAAKANLDKLVAALVAYDIVKGDGSSWTEDSDHNITFVVNGLFSKFVGIKVDGKDVDKANYEVKAGSTIITLKASYLDTLAVGEHTITVVYTDGSTDGTCNVHAKANSPATGDNSNMALWIALLFISGGAVITLTVVDRKRRTASKR